MRSRSTLSSSKKRFAREHRRGGRKSRNGNNYYDAFKAMLLCLDIWNTNLSFAAALLRHKWTFRWISKREGRETHSEGKSETFICVMHVNLNATIRLMMK
jgi:hypothetical protein